MSALDWFEIIAALVLVVLIVRIMLNTPKEIKHSRQRWLDQEYGRLFRPKDWKP